MDAYDLQQEIFKAWQQACKPASATKINKPINDVSVYVDDKEVIGVKIKDNKIILETK
jgi:hypothetical protein